LAFPQQTEFIKQYYESSRLHYLSTWKSEAKDIVDKMHQKYSLKNPTALCPHRHVDFDCFFASVGIKDRPHLVHVPVAVSHSKSASENSSSDVASCNYVARSFGIQNGMPIGTAKSLCPDLQVIPYEFEKYRAISEQFYEILFPYADEIQAVSVDEALLEIGSHAGQEEALATKIRHEVQQTTGCSVSIGIGPNILLARMSTRKAKPAGQFICTELNMDDVLLDQAITDLPGVGYATQEKLNEMHVKVIRDLRSIPLHTLQSKLGTKVGQTLYNFSRGIDDRSLSTGQQRRSVSAEVNWGVRLKDEQEEKIFLETLSKEVSDRLKKYSVKGKTITIKILKRKKDAGEPRKHLGHGSVDSFSKSCTSDEFTDSADMIFEQVYGMLKSFCFDCVDIRGLGIHVTKLNNQPEEVSDQGKLVFKPAGESSTRPEKDELQVDIDVFNELPASVQQELKSNHQLVFTNTNEQDSSTPLPELPPWSKLDPNYLLALPDTMREQVLRMYGNQDISMHEPPVTKNHTRGTLTQLLEIDLPFDVDVLKALPQDVHQEILAEHRQSKKAQKKTEKVPTVQPIEPDEIIAFNKGPVLQDMTDINDIRNLLQAWVSSFEDEPEPEDVITVSNYLIELVHGSDLEKVQLLVMYMAFLLKHHPDTSHWRKHLHAIQRQISETTMAMYGCPLQF
ncbi:deoxycytidyl transferase, partial [Rhizopus stolonifer]